MNSFSTASNGGTPRIRFSFTTITIGCTTTPVNRSVFVKQVSSMLGLFAIGTPTFLLEMFALTSLCRVSPLTEATK